MNVRDDEATRPMHSDDYAHTQDDSLAADDEATPPSQQAGSDDPAAVRDEPTANADKHDEPSTNAAHDEPTANAGAGRPPRVHFRDRQRGWLTHALSASASAPAGAPHPATAGEAADQEHATNQPPTPPRMPARRATAGRRLRGTFAAILAVIILIYALTRLAGPSAPSATPAAPTVPPAPAPPALSATNGAALTAVTVLGPSAKLAAPREAVRLANGDYVVADTDNKRLLFFRPNWHLLKTVTSGAAPLQQPFAVAADKQNVYLLDADRGAIERYDTAGHFKGEVLDNPTLLADARDLALGPRGQIYVANPRNNSIIVLTREGRVVHQFTSALGAAPNDYNQPSAVAVAPSGNIYVLDNANDRIKEIRPDGSYVAQWPAPPSDTLHSVHLLAVAGGRLLASDPSGSLLLYPKAGGTPTRLPLHVAGQSSGGLSPLGLSHLANGRILIADAVGNRLLTVKLP